MGPEDQEAESARVLSLARGPHREHSIFAGTFTTEKGPKTMGFASLRTTKREPRRGEQRTGPGVRTSHYVPFAVFLLVASSSDPVSSLFSLHLFRPLIKGAGSDMSPQTRTG